MACALISLRSVKYKRARKHTRAHTKTVRKSALYFIAISYYNSVIDTKIDLYTFAY